MSSWFATPTILYFIPVGWNASTIIICLMWQSPLHPVVRQNSDRQSIKELADPSRDGLSSHDTDFMLSR